MKKIIITAGGTGGHIYPALSIAGEVKEKMPETEIIFVGSYEGMESKIISSEGYMFKAISISALRGKSIPGIIKSIFKFFAGMVQSMVFLNAYKPSVVVGVGAYVSAPVVLSAFMMNIPTVIHEQNVIPGFTNKILARFVNKVMVSFIESKKYFSSSNVLLTGYPLRKSVLNIDKEKAYKRFNIDSTKKTILVFGGSRGAEGINKIFEQMLSKYHSRLKEFQFIWITGENNFEKYKDSLGKVNIIPYLNEMELAYSAADLVVCRAGAGTIAEITAFGLVPVFVPYPFAASDHQMENAKVITDKGAGIIIEERNLTDELLYEKLIELLDNNEGMKKMSIISKSLGDIHRDCKIEEEIGIYIR